MKNRLQTLWDELTPGGGSCPIPESKDVRRRVDAVLRETGRERRTVRPARLAVIAAAAVLAAGTALAAGDIIPPAFNVLDQEFSRGENASNAIEMMSIDPVSVSDENYTITVTSSLADGNELYFTLIIEAHSSGAWKDLKDHSPLDLLSLRVPGSGGKGCSSWEDPDNSRTLCCVVSAEWSKSDHAAVRLDLMEDGQWLEFPVKPVRSVKLKINAEGWGFGSEGHAAGGPVNLKTLEVSPLSFEMDYTTPYLEQGCPVIYFLYKDGSVKSQGQLGTIYPSGHGSPDGLFGGDERPMRYEYSFQFPSVQDLGGMEAVVFEGMAYPLDGREPYAVDMSGYIRPFTVPIGELLGDSADFSVPFFALCDGLGIPYEWDEESGRASAERGGVTLSFKRDSKIVTAEGPGLEEWKYRLDGASVYRDGELWVDARFIFQDFWELEMNAAHENLFAGAVDEDNPWSDWVVVP